VDNPWADIDITDAENPVASPQPQPNAKRRRPLRWPLVAAGLAGVAALIVAGVIIIVRDREGKEIARIEVPEGSKVEVKDKNVTITPPKTEPKPKEATKVEPKPFDLAAEKDPERRAALWVLSIGGTVWIRQGGPEREVKAPIARRVVRSSQGESKGESTSHRCRAGLPQGLQDSHSTMVT
jgi:hypothetical protein